MALGFDKAVCAGGLDSSNPYVWAGIDLGATAKVLVVGIVNATTTARTGGNPTFGGVTMSQAGTAQAGSAECNSELWYLIDPPTTISVLSIPNSGTLGLQVAYVSFTGTGAAIFGTPQQTGTSSATPSLTINNVPAGGAVVAVDGGGYKDPPTARSHTSIMEVDQGAWSSNMQYGLIASLSNVTCSWTFAASDDVAMIMAAFQEAAGGVSGTLAGTLASVTASMAGVRGESGTVSGTLGVVTANVTGIVRAEGTLGGIVANVTASIVGAHGVSGTVSGTLAPVTASMTGTFGETVTGVLAGTLAALTAAVVGVVRAEGALVGTLASITGAVTGIHGVAGAVSGTLGIATGNMAGTVRVEGALTGTMAAVTADAAGAHGVAGTVAGSTAALTGSFEGTFQESITGTLSGALSALSGSFAGTVRVEGALSGATAPITGVAAGVVRVEGVLSGQISSITAGITGTTGLQKRGEYCSNYLGGIPNLPTPPQRLNDREVSTWLGQQLLPSIQSMYRWIATKLNTFADGTLGVLRVYNNLEAALGIAGYSLALTIVVYDVQTLAADLIIPANVQLRFERCGKIVIPAGKTLTVYGNITAGPWQIFDGPGKVIIKSGNPIVEVLPEWWYPGTGEWSPTFQKACDCRDTYSGTWGARYILKILLGSSDYRFDTCLNLTNTRETGTIQRDCIWLCGTGIFNGSRILGNTGNIVLDTTGNQFLQLSDLTIDTAASGLTNRSVVGILQAPTTTNGNTQCQNHRYKNLTVTMHDDPTANSGLGTVALCNFGAEEPDYIDCWFEANSPVILTGAKSFLGSIDSIYQAGHLPDYHSLGVVSFNGEAFWRTVERRQPALLSADVNTVRVANAYISNIGDTGTNLRALKVAGTLSTLEFQGNIEHLSTFLYVPGTIQNYNIRVNMSEPDDEDAPIIELDMTGVQGIMENGEAFINVYSPVARKLIKVTGAEAGSPYPGDIIDCYLRNAAFKTNQLAVDAIDSLSQNLLFNAHTRNVRIEAADRTLVIGYRTQEIEVPETLVGTLGGSMGGDICKVILPANVYGHAAGGLCLEVDGILSTTADNADATAVKGVRMRQNVAQVYTDGTVTVSEETPENQADIYDDTTPALTSSVALSVDSAKVDASVSGVTSVTFKLIPSLSGTDTGATVYFVGTAKITWAGYYARAPIIGLP